jgi:hypothetical protein
VRPRGVLAGAPNTVWQWLVAAAEQLRAFPLYFRCDVHAHQLQLDELDAVIRALKAGELRAEEAIERLEGAPPWVWTALEPVSKLLLALEVGPRTVERAQHIGHQVASGLAPGWVPAWLSDGFQGYLPAILGHCGLWPPPERRQDKGPVPKPRWMPLPGRLSAQVVKQYRRQRVGGVHHRVGFGTLDAVKPVLAA